MMKKLLTLICAGSVMMFVITNLIAKDYVRAYIIHTRSAAEVKKILARLKNTDPAVYRLTVTSSYGGKTITTIYGNAAVPAIEKINDACRNNYGSYTALCILIMQRGARKQTCTLRNAIISALDKDQATQSLKTIKLSTANALVSNK